MCMTVLLCRLEVCGWLVFYSSGPGCSKLTTSLVNVIKISNLNISNKPIFFVEKMCEASLIFSTKNFSVFGYKVVKHLTS